MFRREAAVKHSLLESENHKYLGTDDGIINVGLMTKLYHVVAHNLNEARKARDGNKKSTKPRKPVVFRVADNILLPHVWTRNSSKTQPTRIRKP